MTPDTFGIGTNALLGVLLAPGLLFAVLYFPAITYLSRSLASAYPKADVRKRMSAATLDASLVAASLWAYLSLESIPFLVAGATYLLLRDAVGGQSLGKLCVGLTVVRLDTGRPAAFKDSVARNLLLLLPGANIAALFLEALTIVRDAQGQRLGDRLAQTQVVDGLGARDLVAALHAWWRGAISELPAERGRKPVDPVPD